MRVMSFNLLCAGSGERTWKKRAPLVVSVIKDTNPDSFGVQEAHKSWMDTLCAALPEYAYVGVGRDDGVDDGEFSAVFYKKNLYTVEQSGSFWLSETPEVPSRGWDSACTRICTWARLVGRETGESYVHMNTHLDHVGITARVEGVKMIKAKAASFNGLPVVCTGDFNVEQGTDCYVEMVSGNMKDARELAESSSESCTFHAFVPQKVHSIIDFVFVDESTVAVKNFKVIDRMVDGEFYSDHYAVYADLEISSVC